MRGIKEIEVKRRRLGRVENSFVRNFLIRNEIRRIWEHVKKDMVSICHGDDGQQMCAEELPLQDDELAESARSAVTRRRAEVHRVSKEGFRPPLVALKAEDGTITAEPEKVCELAREAMVKIYQKNADEGQASWAGFVNEYRTEITNLARQAAQTLANAWHSLTRGTHKHDLCRLLVEYGSKANARKPIR